MVKIYLIGYIIIKFIIPFSQDLRKAVRHLENDIDTKLVTFSKLGIHSSVNHARIESVPLLDEENVFENMASEIESLLTKLIKINIKISEVPPSDAAMLHIMQRHKEILQEYKVEFKKIRNNFMTKKAREDLLGKMKVETEYKGKNCLANRDVYVKENLQIYNSDKLIRDQINIAMDTRDHLVLQKHTLKRIHNKFNNMSNYFPAVNSLVQRIKLRKLKDTITLGFIICFCTVLILLYIFH